MSFFNSSLIKHHKIEAFGTTRDASSRISEGNCTLYNDNSVIIHNF
jgi:hypothetical protein